MFDEHTQSRFLEIISAALAQQTAAFIELQREQMRPSALYKPRVFIDGDQWCALYGTNDRGDAVGYGDSPARACEDFDRNWVARN